MANAKRDENNVPTLICALNTDGSTPTLVKINPANHGLMVDDASTGTGFGRTIAVRDQNNVPVLMGVASATITVNGVDYIQGVTPVMAYADSSGRLLIDSA